MDLGLGEFWSLWSLWVLVALGPGRFGSWSLWVLPLPRRGPAGKGVRVRASLAARLCSIRGARRSPPLPPSCMADTLPDDVDEEDRHIFSPPSAPAFSPSSAFPPPPASQDLVLYMPDASAPMSLQNMPVPVPEYEDAQDPDDLVRRILGHDPWHRDAGQAGGRSTQGAGIDSRAAGQVSKIRGDLVPAFGSSEIRGDLVKAVPALGSSEIRGDAVPPLPDGSSSDTDSENCGFFYTSLSPGPNAFRIEHPRALNTHALNTPHAWNAHASQVAVARLGDRPRRQMPRAAGGPRRRCLSGRLVAAAAAAKQSVRPSSRAAAKQGTAR